MRISSGQSSASSSSGSSSGGGSATKQINQSNSNALQSNSNTLREGFTPPDHQREFYQSLIGWSRYQELRFIGAGGMGQVYQAADPRLKRHVALKFLRYNDSGMLSRFFLEAQAQARIEHENICKVYEVGEVAGYSFIAMQYINGPSLKEGKASLTLEQKVKVMQQVAEAVQAAHRMGMIHRDIKPANIMLEQTDTTACKPYVMDFGLVREIDATGQTISGAIVGTPAFMSPEQARGEIGKLDRRTDLYSIGATLYDLLTGQPPFKGSSGIEIIRQVIEADPLPPRKLNPAIPIDLETIVMKCLEKEQQNRYDSAKAVAEELGRYLDGEPIQARRAGFSYWLKKKARKHKAYLSLLIIALVLIGAFAAMAIHSRIAAAERVRMAEQQARLAQQFGQEVKELEAILRYAYLMRLHDTRPERQLIQQRMRAIESEMQTMGQLGSGPGHYALGRGYLALQNYQLAHQHLQIAWQSGYQEPGVKYALGQVLGALYQKALREADRIKNRDLQESRLREIAQQYREPALKLLKESVGSTAESPAYVEGLIAFYEQKYQLALTKTRQAYHETPWLYEAHRLEGDIEIALGFDQERQGLYDEALAHYNQAGVAYQAAIEIGQSDATNYVAESHRWNQIMWNGFRRSIDPSDNFNRLLAVNDQALQADPDNVAALDDRSMAYCRVGQYQQDHGQSSEAAIEQAIAIAKQALQIDPADSFAYQQLANAYQRKGRTETEMGQEPRQSLQQAIDNYIKASQLDPTVLDTYNSLALTYWQLAIYQDKIGQDPRPTLAQSLTNFQKAIEMDAKLAYLYSNLTIPFAEQAKYEFAHGLNADDSFAQATSSLSKSIEMNPNFGLLYANLSALESYYARYQITAGKDPGAKLDSAWQHAKKAQEIDHNLAISFGNAGYAALIRAQYQLKAGIDLRDSCAQAIPEFNQAIKINGNYASPYLWLGEIYRLRGEYLRQQGSDPTADLAQARTALTQATTIDRSNYENFLALSRVELVAARYAIDHKRSPQESLNRSRQAIEQAIKLNQFNAENYQVAAEIHYWQASSGPANQLAGEIAAGLAMADQSLQINARLASALALRGKLLQLSARAEPNREQRTALEKQAQTAIKQASEIDPLIEESRQ